MNLTWQELAQAMAAGQVPPHTSLVAAKDAANCCIFLVISSMLDPQPSSPFAFRLRRRRIPQKRYSKPFVRGLVIRSLVPPPSLFLFLHLFLAVMMPCFVGPFHTMQEFRAEGGIRRGHCSAIVPPPPLVQPPCLQREASGKLVSAAKGGADLKQVLALGADIDIRDWVSAAAAI